MSGPHNPGHKQIRRPGIVVCLCGWSSGCVGVAGRSAYHRHLVQIRDERQAKCRDCGEVKYLRLMSASKPSLCKRCSTARTRAWKLANPKQWERHARNAHLRKQYGITVDEFDCLLAAQGGVCAVCKREGGDSRGYRMHVDHDHATGRVRGILCGPCNQGIGNLGDDPERVAAAADYLREHACTR